MFSTNLMNEIHINILNTVIILIILSLIYGSSYWIIIKKSDGEKTAKKFIARLTYLSIFTLFFLLAKIWVKGFSHLFEVLTLMSAGLAIANKEIILNFMGWFVINWRGLFSEGDYIQINNYRGYVYEIGVLYFKLAEESHLITTKLSGHIIKIPNSIAMSNSIRCIANRKQYIQYELSWIFTFDSDLARAKQLIVDEALTCIDEKFPDYYAGSKKKHFNFLGYQKDLSPRAVTTVRQKKPHGAQITLCYFCQPEHQIELQEQFTLRLLAKFTGAKNIHLSLE